MWPAEHIEEGLFGGGACGALCFMLLHYQLRLHKTRCYCCIVFYVSLVCYIAVVQLNTFIYRFSKVKSSTSLMSLVIHPHNKGNLSFYASEFISILYTQKLSYTKVHYFSVRTYGNTVPQCKYPRVTDDM